MTSEPTSPAFLSYFTPSLMTPETLEAIFVQREETAARLVTLIRDAALTPAKHHTLLIGPRGIGKTHLVSLVYHRLARQEDLRGRLRVAWMREEEWGVTSLLDLLLRVLRALAAEYPSEVPAARVEALYELKPDEAEHAAGRLLREIVGDERTLLLIAENLDDLFQGLGDNGQKRLRAYLQDHAFITILATSQSLFGGVALQTSPFYGFFRIQHLQELDLPDAVALLTKIAELRHDRALADFIPTPTGRARIRAVQELAGGHPRIYVLFSQFLTRDALDALVAPFLSMLDDLTPYYQARMAWLSPQQRKIVELLCDRRHAVPVKEIAQRCFISHQTASSQLKDLRDKGYVRSHAVGRDSYYELREPLMRLCIEVKKHRGEPIRLFVEFLRLWHSRDELQQRLASVDPGAVVEKQYLSVALRMSEAEPEDPRIAACLNDYYQHVSFDRWAEALQATEDLVAIRGNREDFARQSYCLIALGLWEEALQACKAHAAKQPNDMGAWGASALVLNHLERFEEALAAADRAIAIDANIGTAWLSRATAYFGLGEFKKALLACNKSLEVDSGYALSWKEKANILLQLERPVEALEAITQAVKIDKSYPFSWFLKGLIHFKKAQFKKAVNSFEKAVKLYPEFALYSSRKAVALVFDGRFEEAFDCFKQSLSLAKKEDIEFIVQDFTDMIFGFVYHKPDGKVVQGWLTLSQDRPDLQLPARLLDTAVRWRESRDPRVLLALPIEERRILQEVLNLPELPDEA